MSIYNQHILTSKVLQLQNYECIITAVIHEQSHHIHCFYIPKGEFKNNKFDGKGVFTWVEGDKYIGQFKNGKSEGYGIEIFTNGDRYEGEYLNDLFEGQG